MNGILNPFKNIQKEAAKGYAMERKIIETQTIGYINKQGKAIKFPKNTHRQVMRSILVYIKSERLKYGTYYKFLFCFVSEEYFEVMKQIIHA